MRTGLIIYRLIGLLLAITTFYPSWISGPCCCTQMSVAKRPVGTCCSQGARGPGAVSNSSKKACCAARAVARNTEPGQPTSVRPVSNCCCRLHLHTASLSGLVRSVELTIAISDVPVANVDQAAPHGHLQSNPKWNVTGDPDDPREPSERCALLCRWLS